MKTFKRVLSISMSERKRERERGKDATGMSDKVLGSDNDILSEHEASRFR